MKKLATQKRKEQINGHFEQQQNKIIEDHSRSIKKKESLLEFKFIEILHLPSQQSLWKQA